MPTAHAQEDREFRLPIGEDVPLEVMRLEDAAFRPEVEWAGRFKMDTLHGIVTGKGVRVGIADTGIDANHPAYAGRVRDARDFTGSRSGAADVNGHGTHCAGIVAAKIGAAIGKGAAPDAELYAAKVLGDSGSGGGRGIAAGIDWLAEQGCEVISCSFGSDGPDPLVNAAIQRAAAKGILCVVAAGNAGPRPGTVGWPGALPEVVCVGAVDGGWNIANFSSRGPEVDVSFLGVNVLSAAPGGRAATMSGTSMATPGVAGLAACAVQWLRSRSSEWDADDVRNLLLASCVLPVPNANPTSYGRGIPVLADKLSGPPAPPPPPPPVTWPPSLHVGVAIDAGGGLILKYGGDLARTATSGGR